MPQPAQRYVPAAFSPSYAPGHGRPVPEVGLAGRLQGRVLGGRGYALYAVGGQAQVLCERPGSFELLRSDRA